MASTAFKPVVERFITPLAKGMLAVGITPNVLTVVGAIGSSVSASYFFSNGRFIVGVIAVSIFTLSDLFDGTMARLSSRGPSAWGGFLDSTFDRITDAAIVGGLIIYFIRHDDSLVNLAVVVLILGALIPYIRAKAESLGIACAVGIAERTERLVLLVSGIFLEGLGVPYALAIALNLLVLLSAITVVQRIMVIYKGLK